MYLSTDVGKILSKSETMITNVDQNDTRLLKLGNVFPLSKTKKNMMIYVGDTELVNSVNSVSI